MVTVDPLSGFDTMNTAMPCGSIFGVSRPSSDRDGSSSPRQLVAGYILYASATIMVITFGDGVYSFTLDVPSGEFVLGNTQLRIPARGQCYSVNERGYGQWPPGMQSYIQTIVQGNGQTQKPYSSRNSTSVVADFHRMLVQGGVFLNPGHHVPLMHVSMPLSLLTEQAGGKATDGNMRLLDHKCDRLDRCVPSFLGSIDDMAELSTYLQQPYQAPPISTMGM
ncbi:fructose-1,6-bisphosphatase class 1-like [Convolutriloba macropyga]|uniref:fructose-1,6-bisphosphatase class 1-like n=1 Tax=Convolutriloba macropyga TaxID=536237 RepID=UPI003F527E42